MRNIVGDLNILIVDDIPAARKILMEAVRDALRDQTSATIHFHEAGSLTEAWPLLDLPLDVALVDLRLPDGSGADLIRRIKENQNIIAAAVTVMDDHDSIEAALAAGAEGYLLKDSEPALLSTRLKRLLEGEPSLSPSIARFVLSRFNGDGVADQSEDSPTRLTNREREVLSLVARGLRASEAAEQLSISAHTVRDHLKSIYRKLDVSSRAEATLEARKMNLT